MNKHRETLMKFIGEQNQRIQNDISKQGYKDNSPYKNNPSNLIQGKPGQPTSITMKGVSTPLIGMDEFGNKQYMQPGQEYQFPGSQVTETPIAQLGTEIKPRPTYKNFLASINKDKVVDYKKIPRRNIVVESTKTISPKTQ